MENVGSSAKCPGRLGKDRGLLEERSDKIPSVNLNIYRDSSTSPGKSLMGKIFFNILGYFKEFLKEARIRICWKTDNAIITPSEKLDPLDDGGGPLAKALSIRSCCPVFENYKSKGNQSISLPVDKLGSKKPKLEVPDYLLLMILQDKRG
ncbi:hypothetical protein RUM44_007858 [Polyplax serrata]|uniref:Uncharacterized protein n=1 Tax=Polyplax serrata TaxID=468196 RepID=A0ABR1B7B7_POLSC